MRGKEAILAACGLAVVGVLVFLALEVSRPGEVEIDRDKLDQARADHQRLLAARQSEVPPPVNDGESETDWAALRAQAAAADPDRGSPDTEASRDIASTSRSFETRRPEPEREPEPEPIDVAMDDTNALYDKADYEGAMAAALEVLERDPGNVRMLRVVVSSGCILGDATIAESHYQQLRGRRDRLHMRVRCKRYGVDLPQ